MNFLADESLDGPIVEGIRQAGHRVLCVAEMAPSLPDERVLDLANREEAVLLTADRDFGELVFRMRQVTAGVVLVRLAGLSPEEKALIVRRAVAAHHEQLTGAFSVVLPTSVRIRQTP